MVLPCPELFARAPLSLDAVHCGTLDNIASIKMNTVRAVILHKFMHWLLFTEAVAGIDILDRKLQNDPSLDQHQAADGTIELLHKWQWGIH